MQIPCPHCNEQLPISKEFLGKKIRCGGCNEVVVVPESIGKPEVKSAPAPKPEESGVLVKCVCGNQCRIPEATSEFCCPECQHLMRIPDPSAPKIPTIPTNPVFPSGPLASANAPSSGDFNHPYQAKRQTSRKPSKYSDKAILYTAVASVLGLIVVVGALIIKDLVAEPEQEVAETAEVQDETAATTQMAYFNEGYSVELPRGFNDPTKEINNRGYTIYRRQTKEGYQFTLAFIPSSTTTRISIPPNDLSKASFRSVRGLEVDPNLKVEGKRVSIDGMPAVIFRYHERETYRGINFTYYMLAMGEGRKIAAKFSGRYNGYDEDEEDITEPNEWYDSLLSIRTVTAR